MTLALGLACWALVTAQLVLVCWREAQKRERIRCVAHCRGNAAAARKMAPNEDDPGKLETAAALLDKTAEQIAYGLEAPEASA